jgi:hypothetical protein
MCQQAAKHLSLKVNNRDALIVYDAELSVLKVTHLELAEYGIPASHHSVEIMAPPALRSSNSASSLALFELSYHCIICFLYVLLS